MIQLKLKLNSNKPTTVYAANGKTYQLNPGSNVLNLEYEDYLSLAKALGIKPVDNKKQEEPENKENKEDNQSEEQEELENKEDNQAEVKEESENKEKKEDNPAEEQEEPENKEDQDEVKKEPDNKEDKAEEQEELENKEKKEDNPSEEQEVDLVNECVDYSAWSLKQLKSEYKKITGENCKLKKDDIISFLQERTSNA